MIVSFGEVLMDCLPANNLIGGAPFNVAINLKRMGNTVEFISKIGKDEFGQLIFNLATKENIAKSIQRSDQLKTGYVTVDFVKKEPKYTIHDNVAWQNIETKKTGIIDYLIFGSLATFKEQNKATLQHHIESNKQAIKICDLNLRSPFYNNEHIKYCIDNCEILKVNEEEWYDVLDIYQLPEVEFMKKFHNRQNTIGVIITKGDKGACFKSTSENYTIYPEKIKPNEFQDSIGAGDGFLAAFLNEWIQSKNIEQALQEGISYASLICKNKGAIL